VTEAVSIAGEAVRFATAREAIAVLSASFREAGVPTPELDARILVLEACGLSAEAYILHPETPVGAAASAAIDCFQNRRRMREPVCRILGVREFWGRRFTVTPDVLDPRPDTETLIEAAFELIGGASRDKPLRILDLGTGSGCILLTLLAEMPQSWGVGADISAAALMVARRNAEQLGLASRAAFVQCDWGETFSEAFGLIICNPPYIENATIDALDAEVRCYDPVLALDGGTDGLAAYERIAWNSARIAQKDAWVLLEVGSGQAPEVLSLFADAGWDIGPDRHRLFQDLTRIDRVVAIKRQATSR
jgi:release factor glutamine methyltransferase